jgi:hypothetical protein
MFYEQLLCAQIPKVQINTDDGLTVFFSLLGSACVTASRKHVGEIDPNIQIRQFCLIFNTQCLSSEIKMIEISIL